MLSKSERLARLEMTNKNGRRAVFAYGAVRFIKMGRPKGAVVVSKKDFKTAVLRHTVRRKTLASLRRLMRNGRISGGVIVYPNRGAVNATSREIETALAKVL